MIGWTFYLTQPVVLTGLGWYDDGLDGLADPHQIGIWKDQSGRTDGPYMDLLNAANTSALVLSATIPVGTAAPLDGSWRRLDFNVALTLEPGGYEIAGRNYAETADVVNYFKDSPPEVGRTLPADPRLEVGAPAADLRFGSEVPTFHQPQDFWLVYGVELGPMLFIEAIPEPSTVLLLAGGLGFWLLARRWRGAIQP